MIMWSRDEISSRGAKYRQKNAYFGIKQWMFREYGASAHTVMDGITAIWEIACPCEI
jgi:hypothetical protein